MGAVRSSLSLYLAEIRTHARLRPDEEARVARASRFSGAALDRLVEANLSFVVKLAKEFRNQGLPFEDLISEGNLGLIRAARRYDPRRRVKFITYAAYWVRKAIRKALSEQSSMIRIPDYQRRKARATGGDDASPGGRSVSGSPRLVRQHVSLDQPLGEDGGKRLGDFIVSSAIDPETATAERDLRRRLRDTISALEPRSRAILANRLGLSDEDPSTLRALAARLGMSHERVRQIEEEARRHVQARLTGRSRP